MNGALFVAEFETLCEAKKKCDEMSAELSCKIVPIGLDSRAEFQEDYYSELISKLIDDVCEIDNTMFGG